ncbi:hypothetical protein [Paludibacterium denitrificans]|uniref:Uncharacterized protein n=1 Tax=Paludibacterium denitrificans TaxID=2675226 RepID=A0A844GGE5_9NEIS|nr:hypothetical protein [Paludibacterium denitrificans]MTD33957.1 hypothetical protein [Paludibacterium denitrificans]
MQTIIGMWEPERVYQQVSNDQLEPIYLAVWKAQDEKRYVKAVINANYRVKDKDRNGKRIPMQTNTLTTLGYVDLRDLNNPALYRRII